MSSYKKKVKYVLKFQLAAVNIVQLKGKSKLQAAAVMPFLKNTDCQTTN